MIFGCLTYDECKPVSNSHKCKYLIKLKLFGNWYFFPVKFPFSHTRACEKMEQCVGLENWDDINNVSLAPDPQISRNNWRRASEPDHPIFSITHKSGLCSSVHTLERHADPGILILSQHLTILGSPERYLWSMAYLWPDVVSIKMIPFIIVYLPSPRYLIVGRYLHCPGIKRLMAWLNWLHNRGDDRTLTANQRGVLGVLTNQRPSEPVNYCPGCEAVRVIWWNIVRRPSLRLIICIPNDTPDKSIGLLCWVKCDLLQNLRSACSNFRSIRNVRVWGRHRERTIRQRLMIKITALTHYLFPQNISLILTKQIRNGDTAKFWDF